MWQWIRDFERNPFILSELRGSERGANGIPVARGPASTASPLSECWR